MYADVIGAILKCILVPRYYNEDWITLALKENLAKDECALAPHAG